MSTDDTPSTRTNSFALQDRFVSDFLASLTPAARESVIGTPQGR